MSDHSQKAFLASALREQCMYMYTAVSESAATEIDGFSYKDSLAEDA